MQKIFADVGSYYLMSYYSTNQKLDGRFRRIRVEVKRPDVDVRARPGYLAPTESEARAAGVAIARAGRANHAPPPTVTRALDALAPARGNLPVRVQAVGGRSTIRAIVELDRRHGETAGVAVGRHAAADVRAGADRLARAVPAQSQTLTMADRARPAQHRRSTAASSRWRQADTRSAPS